MWGALYRLAARGVCQVPHIPCATFVRGERVGSDASRWSLNGVSASAVGFFLESREADQSEPPCEEAT
jgi:hypothetical protein